jgi:hypothetical protein
MALSGFEATSDDDLTGSALTIVGLALEKARHEATTLRLALGTEDDSITAGSLEGRLEALEAFINDHMDVRWRDAKPANRSLQAVDEDEETHEVTP